MIIHATFPVYDELQHEYYAALHRLERNHARKLGLQVEPVVLEYVRREEYETRRREAIVAARKERVPLRERVQTEQQKRNMQQLAA